MALALVQICIDALSRRTDLLGPAAVHSGPQQLAPGITSWFTPQRLESGFWTPNQFARYSLVYQMQHALLP
jgi:hypothetical protein